MKHVLTIDLETFGGELEAGGVYRYTEAPDFAILIMAYSLDGADVQVIDTACGEEPPAWLVAALHDPDYIKASYNAAFEMTCLGRYYGEMDPAQWSCSMIHGLYAGYPAGLEDIGKAIGLPLEKQKLSIGKSLIKYFCIPCNPTKRNGGRTRNLPEHDPEKWALFKEYCKQDVMTEMEIDRRLQHYPVPAFIHKQWETDQRINRRGIYVDLDLVQGALDLDAEAREGTMEEARELTGLKNPNSAPQVLGWLRDQEGLELPNYKRGTVAAALQDDSITDDARRVLEIRQELGKTSTRKYNGDIIRKACNYIDSHKDYFGPTILEVGCDCGVISCFLANIFPEAKIVAIDRCPNAIEIARKFAQDRGVENITFIESDLKDIKETFDTVFSMRTVHENIASDEDIINDLGEQAEIFKDGLYEYASALSNVLSSQGTLISIERIGRNALLLGWMKALDEADLVFDLTCYEELICNEAGDKSVFQAFASFKGIESEIEAKDLFDFACSKYLDYSKAQYEGWEAKIVFENRRGTLIEGYNLVYTTPVAKVRASLWTHKTDETCLVMYQNNNGVVSTTFHDVSLKEELLKSLHNAIEESQKYGNVTITQMS